MTSLQHHSHLMNHSSNSNSNTLNVVTIFYFTSAIISAALTFCFVEKSLNNSSNNLSPVIQRKIESVTSVGGFSRYSTGNSSVNGPGANIGADFDTTSIASVSESSHWSGGGGDDLDNIALVNGSDCMNTMENKDWSTYIKMAKNGYNSSDEDNNTNNNDDVEEDVNDSNEEGNGGSRQENDDDLSLCDEATKSKNVPLVFFA